MNLRTLNPYSDSMCPCLEVLPFRTQTALLQLPNTVVQGLGNATKEINFLKDENKALKEQISLLGKRQKDDLLKGRSKNVGTNQNQCGDPGPAGPERETPGKM